MSPEPVRLAERTDRRRFHLTRVKPGCRCSKCARLQAPVHDLDALIALYEARLVVFREERARQQAQQ